MKDRSTIHIKRIHWDTISEVWQRRLWPDRQSPIETHSAWTWPHDNYQQPVEMGIFEYQPLFLGAYADGVLIGVNSGHLSRTDHYRSRGLWVNPEARGCGIAQMLFAVTESHARGQGAKMMWSVPRATALTSYCLYGFEPVGEVFHTETNDENIYVRLML